MIRARLIASAALAAVLAMGGEALALPTSPTITGTNGPGPGATFTFGTNTLTVNQTNSRVFVDWSGFNIASGETVTFSQPSNSAIALNRVATNSFTTIAGSLNANGSVWIISPAGILVGAGAAVNVGSFFASTSIADSTTLSDFLCNCNGTVHFSPQAVTATPSITVQSGASINANAGFVELNSISITQNGTVSATDAVEYLAIPSAKVDFDSGPNGLTNPNVDINNIAAPQNQPTSIVHGGVTTAGGFVALESFNDPSLGAPVASVINLSGHITANGILRDPETGSTFGVILIADGGSPGTNSQFAVPTNDATVLDASGGVITSTWAIGAEAGTVKTGAWTSGADTGAGFNIEAGVGGLDIPHALNFTGVGAVSLSSLGNLSIEGPITNGANGGMSISSAAFSLALTGSITNSHGPLSVTASGPMTVDGAITPSGEGASFIESGPSPVVLNGSFGAGGDLGQGVSLAFTGAPDSGQSLTINGQAYGLIFNESELVAINNNLAGHYALAAPLDMGAVGFGGAPIASLADTPFTGVFTGLGNAISDLTVRQTTPVVQLFTAGYATTGEAGLFGNVGASGLVENVSLQNAAVVGVDGMQVGALVGALAGTVVDASSSGEVGGGSGVNTPQGYAYADVGGLVGSGGTILRSQSSATVFAGNAFAGGLVGAISASSVSSIAGSYASGDVFVGSAPGGAGVPVPTGGGLVGLVYGYQFGGVNPVVLPVTGSGASGQVGGGGGSILGGFVGEIVEGQVTGSYATGSVHQTAPGQNGHLDFAGGFAGVMFTGASVSQSYASGAVQTVGGASSTDYTLAGGFVGDMDQGSSVSSAYSLGSVTTTGAFTDIGGFAGIILDGASADHVYATGLVAGPGAAGGLVGVLGNGGADPTGFLSNSYWDEGTTGRTTAFCCGTGTATNVIGVGGSTGLSPYAASSYGNFDLANTWFMIGGETRPMLRSEYSTTITDAHQLQLMAMNLGASYTLGNDIDMSEDTSAAGVWNPANGFVPVGPNPSAPFLGILDGAGHTISNLTITDTTPLNQTVFGGYALNGFVGLFGFVGHGGSVENLALANVNVTGGDGMDVGALTGAVQGTLANVSTAGTVTVGNGVSTGLGYAGAYAGGLSGTFDGLIIDSSSSAVVTGGDAAVGGLVGATGANAGIPAGLIVFSHATGAVSVGGAPGAGQQLPSAGGLVGALYGYQFGGVNPIPDSIAVSYATGTVTGGGGSSVGGLVGTVVQGSVTASYATGAVTQTAGGQNGQDNLAGGFVGYVGAGSIVDKSYSTGAVTTVGGPTNALYTLVGGFAGDADQAAVIEKDYSLGAVTAGGTAFSLVGGFAGIILNSASANQVYATGLVTSPGLAGGLVGLLNNPGFLSNSYWDEGTTGRTNAIGGGAGSQTNVVGIGGSTGLSPYAQATYAGFDFGSQNSGDWVIIPGETRPILHDEFSTTITNGHQLQLMALAPTADYTIANDIDMSETANAAGVWNPANGFVPVGGNGQGAFIGSLDGQSHTISNLTIIDTTPILQNDRVFANGAVGLFGFTNGGALIQNINLANVHVTGGDGMRVGALVGIEGAGAIVDASSSGVVATGSTTTNGGNAVVASAGGLVGASAAGSILDSHSSATVSGVSAYAGGLVGSFFGSTIRNSYATGAVSVGAYSGFLNSGALGGGLIGSLSGNGSGGPSVTTGSYATGTVSGGAGSIIGGFAGFVQQQAQVSNSYATGNVTQTAGGQNGQGDLAGGFVGGVSGASIAQSFSSGAVTTVGGSSGLTTYAGGFAGTADGGAVANAYSTGSVTSSGSAFAGLGGFVGIVQESGTVDRVYATGLVSGPGQLAGLAGQLGNPAQTDTSGSLSNSYWDEGTTGQTSGYHLAGTGAATNVAGVGGATGISPFVAATYAGWDFSNIWSSPSAGFYPELYGVSHVLRVTAGTVSSLYGTFPMETLGLYGLQSGDDASIVQGLSFALAGTTTASSGYYNVGVYGFSASGGAASDASGAYRLIYVNGSLTVTPRPLAASLAGSVEKTYDGGTAATLAAGNYQLAGMIAGDSVALNDPVIGSYDTKSAGAAKLVSVGGLLLTGTDAANYTVNGSASAAIGIIDPKVLAASLTGTVQKTYDGTTAATLAASNFQLAGVVAGDSVAVNDPAGGTYDTRNVGSAKLVSVGGLLLTGTDAANYTVNGAASASIGVIDAKSLTVSLVGSVEKTYDGGASATLAAGNYQLGGVIGGDSVAINNPASGTYAGKDAGSGLVVSVAGLALSGTDAANYAVSGSASAPIGIIDPKALTASLVGTVQKPFDGTATATLAASNYQLAGVIGADSVALNDPATGSFDNANVGTGKVVTVSGLALSGAAASDYSVNGSASAPIGAITAVAAIAPPIQVQIVTIPTQTALTQFPDSSQPTSGQSAGGTQAADAAPVSPDASPTASADQSAGADQTAGATQPAGAPSSGGGQGAPGTQTATADQTTGGAGQPVSGSGPSADAGASVQASTAAAADASAASQTVGEPHQSAQAGVFPVAKNAPSGRRSGDSSPVTGAGNGDLWTGSDLGGGTQP